MCGMALDPFTMLGSLAGRGLDPLAQGIAALCVCASLLGGPKRWIVYVSLAATLIWLVSGWEWMRLDRAAPGGIAGLALVGLLQFSFYAGLGFGLGWLLKRLRAIAIRP
jgi:hypothetical protein